MLGKVLDCSYAKILDLEIVNAAELFSRDNFIAQPQPLDESTLHEPLSSYFINSSHNSYMWGTNQLTAASKAEALEKCLQQGARVIELDVYDDDETGRPVVGHGGMSVHRWGSGGAVHKDVHEPPCSPSRPAAVVGCQ